MTDYIFDIDGTIANCEHRVHYVRTKPKNWRAFDAGAIQDEPILPVVHLLRTLHLVGDRIVLASGRSDRNRDVTIQWLQQHNIWQCVDGLYMRRDKDYRADDIVKSELLDEILADGYEPAMVFDDRSRVVNMWRDRGLICAQVAPGDF